jgi:hypothetical protein
VTRLLTVLAFAALIGTVQASSEPAQVPGPNPIQTENTLPGADSSGWQPPHVSPTRIQGYASEASVLPGEDVHLHVGTSAGDRYRVELYRLGWYNGAGARLIACVPSCGSDKPGQAFGTGNADPVTGVVRANWPVRTRFRCRPPR